MSMTRTFALRSITGGSTTTKNQEEIMTETTCTLTGNLTADPELRFTPSGAAVANFTVAATSRTLDKTTNQWRDGQALFMRCTLWRQPAENLAESLSRGDRVIVTGRLRQRSFDTREGDKRTTTELDVEEIGASLKFTTLTLTKTDRVTAQARASEQTADDEPPF